MSSWINRIKNYVYSGRIYAGKDLQGNKYYEYPVKGIRPKRMVKYKTMVHLSDYTSGKLKLPVQWRAWLTFTRTNPPSLDELQNDYTRIQDLSPRIAAIEERERLERIRQGYAIADSQSSSPTPRISEPSFTPPPSIPFPSFPLQSASSSPKVSSAQVSQSRLPASGSGKYHVPTPTSPGVASTGTTVNPSRHSSPEGLRRLAEEDTKRRIKESGEEQVAQVVEEAKVVPNKGMEGVGLGGSLKPRRRGGA